MEISRLELKDIVKYQDPIKGLLRICFRSTFGKDIDDELIDEKYKSLIEHSKADRAYVYGAISEGFLIGFLWGYPVDTLFETVFHIAYIAVFEEGRRKGIGQRLLLEAEKQAIQLGIDRSELIVGALNNQAVDFYGKAGYQICRHVMHKSVK